MFGVWSYQLMQVHSVCCFISFFIFTWAGGAHLVTDETECRQPCCLLNGQILYQTTITAGTRGSQEATSGAHRNRKREECTSCVFIDTQIPRYLDTAAHALSMFKVSTEMPFKYLHPAANRYPPNAKLLLQSPETMISGSEHGCANCGMIKPPSSGYPSRLPWVLPPARLELITAPGAKTTKMFHQPGWYCQDFGLR